MKYNDIGLEKAAPFTKNIYLVKDVIYVCVCVLYMLITYILYIYNTYIYIYGITENKFLLKGKYI